MSIECTIVACQSIHENAGSYNNQKFLKVISVRPCKNVAILDKDKNCILKVLQNPSNN